MNNGPNLAAPAFWRKANRLGGRPSSLACQCHSTRQVLPSQSLDSADVVNQPWSARAPVDHMDPVAFTNASDHEPVPIAGPRQ